MLAPTILIMDDEPDVLAALKHDLRQHFQNNYRIVKAEPGAKIQDEVRRLARAQLPYLLARPRPGPAPRTSRG